MKCHRFLVYFETYLAPIIQFVRNISSILQTWQNDRIWRLFVFWFHQKSFTTICELSWMPTTESILSSRLRSVPPCRLRPAVLSDHICLAHWVVVIYRFYCITKKTTKFGSQNFGYQICFSTRLISYINRQNLAGVDLNPFGKTVLTIHPLDRWTSGFSLTLKHRETHGCVVSTVATDALVLKHQAISILSTD